ncbi:Non-specific serine/threonine protein kinase [Bertholletia excelsa]
MGLAARVVCLAVQLFAIVVAVAAQGSAGHSLSPSPAVVSAIPPIERPPGLVHGNPTNAPSPTASSQPDGSILPPPPMLPMVQPAPVPETVNGLAPSLSASAPTVFPPPSTVPPPLAAPGIAPSLQPTAPLRGELPKNKSPVSAPAVPATVVLPPSKLPEYLPTMPPVISSFMPPSSPQKKEPNNKAPLLAPIVPVPVATPPSKLPPSSPSAHPTSPKESPSNLPEPDVSPVSTPPSSINWTRDGIPVAAPPNEMPNQLSPVDPPPQKAPIQNDQRHSDNAPPPLVSPTSPPIVASHAPASLPSTSFSRRHRKENITSLPSSSPPLPAPASSPISSPPPSYPPKSHPRHMQRHHAGAHMNSGMEHFSSPQHPCFPPSKSHSSPAPSPSPTVRSGHSKMPVLSPKTSPSRSSPRNPKMPLLPPIHSLPPPPPNEDCSSLTCPEPTTNTPPGTPCGCVWPMQVGLRLSVALYTFFPLVSELAEEIAVGVFMKQSQVRIMGANAATQDPEKTIILTDLVPLGDQFDNTTAYLIFQRFWHKQVVIKTSFFGDYEVLYVRYPGLPPSPPSGINVVDGEPYSGHGNNGRTIQPLGVDVRRGKHKSGLSGSVIAIIVLSAIIAVFLCCVIAWILLFKQQDNHQALTPMNTQPSISKPSGIAASMFGSGPSSASLSFGSSIATYTGSAKTFSSSDIERATDNFNSSRILGEGGFGRVYSGILEGGTKVAVKVLKRDDHQGSREFLAEVEMLSRLHHRNLVKLIGICTEDPTRSLVYELIPNGSLESHLHGVDKVTAPLDWGARMKIALGAARGLAYLHEDSSPRVIHRDFKSSNILLEHDFTPKVSDFGLARTALDEENRHISTRVMGTFGYVAPEYAMTGHLLVKSDVYSYGVVLLELLTGRKPVDMSQPPGQENLVAWARPLLTNKEGLESIIDPSLGPDFPFDSIAKVAAIASMCVQPEVSHRPFMGEVVQALKLVCNECDEMRELGSRSCSHEDLSLDSGLPPSSLQAAAQSPVSNYEPAIDMERGLSMSDLLSSSAGVGRVGLGSFRRHSSSGPLRPSRRDRLWQKLRKLSRGAVSEHSAAFRLWPGSQ